MTTQRQSSFVKQRLEVGSVLLMMGLIVLALVMLPSTAAGQTQPQATPTATVMAATTTTPAAGATATTTPTPNSLTLSSASGLPGATITANGSGFQSGETVDVSFNGQSVGTPTANAGGTFSLSFSVPNLAAGQYGVLAKGATSGLTESASFTINQGGATLSFNPPQAAAGTSLTVTGSGFRPGESVQLSFNGAVIGTSTADTNGAFTQTFTVPATLAAGQYGVTATGQTSGISVNATYTLVAGTTPVATAAATATPTPVAQGATQPVPNAPAMVHDDRYFSQTGFRIDSDDVWNFFQQYGGITTFGYPTSRNMTFLGCPVQMFQRQIIQVCAGQGAALINMLDPEIFPYTQVNGSTFPAPDTALKNSTPPVSSPTYSADIISFIGQNVPDAFGGQPVNFLQHFNATGGLVIWGAPISPPAPDPSNGNFIYQRFQRGIMHYIAGTGTESILLADYLKAILMNQNVPGDLMAQSRESRYFSQYCPGQPLWLCRPNDLPGTDLSFAFVQG
ncbi:MAG TPA: hypothetical protein VF937_04475 [Chloroflexota bacterium]